MPTKRLYCPKCGYETDGHVPVPGVQHRLCPSCKLEHLLEDDGGGRRVARMTDDFRQCRRCGKWFISGEISNEPCLACVTKEMAKLEAEPAPPDGATGGMITLSAGKGTAAEAGVFEFRSTADRIRVNAATGQVEISRAGGEWAPFAELPAQAQEQTAAPKQAAEPEARPRRRFRLEDDEKE